METTLNEQIKTLFKEKTMARLFKYQDGAIYYHYALGNHTYEFSIPVVTVTEDEVHVGDCIITMSEDLGTTAFGRDVRASELTRWIKAAAFKGELKKIV